MSFHWIQGLVSMRAHSESSDVVEGPTRKRPHTRNVPAVVTVKVKVAWPLVGTALLLPEVPLQMAWPPEAAASEMATSGAVRAPAFRLEVGVLVARGRLADVAGAADLG